MFDSKIEPILINSALLSAQSRQRLYWTNIPNVRQPEDLGIVLKDILEDDFDSERDKSYCIDANYYKGANVEQYQKKSRRQLVNKPKQIGKIDTHSVVISKIREKSKTVRSGGRASYDRHEWDSVDELHWRKLTPLECERLQTVPDNYTASVSNTQRYKMLGNGWTVGVIAHILTNMETK